MSHTHVHTHTHVARAPLALRGPTFCINDNSLGAGYLGGSGDRDHQELAHEGTYVGAGFICSEGVRVLHAQRRGIVSPQRGTVQLTRPLEAWFAGPQKNVFRQPERD